MEAFSWPSIVGIGGPASILTLILVWLLSVYKTKKTEDRADEQLERTSESGIVETTGAALLIVRDELTRIGQEQQRLRDENAEQRVTIIGLEKRVRELEWENQGLKRQLENLGGEK